MDRGMNNRQPGGEQPRAKIRSANSRPSESSESFSEQLRGFLRRNMTWFLVAGLVLLIIQDVFGTHGVLAMHHSEKQAAELHNQINQLDQENRKLQDRVERLKTDPGAIEKIAREQMGLARPGEMIFPLSPQPGDSQSAPAQPADAPAKKP